MARFLDWVKEISLRVDGSGYRTMLRNDAYWFSRLGIFLERADNTARILDVKYHVLLPENVDGRRRDRLFAMGGDPARGLGADRLSLGLSREPEAAADRRPDAAQRPDAALARLLLRRDRAPTSTASPEAYGKPGRGAAPGARHAQPRWRTAASSRSSRPACTSSRETVIKDNSRARRGHQPSNIWSRHPVHAHRHPTSHPLHLCQPGQVGHADPAPDAAQSRRPERAALAHRPRLRRRAEGGRGAVRQHRSTRWRWAGRSPTSRSRSRARWRPRTRHGIVRGTLRAVSRRRSICARRR